ncbi:MAG: undecaprenyl-phosphate glucose phosphotransferase [Candidatus Omnitrophica bacterium]|nr:undecaprenyl-phosphate glucose phosphotransferase [Candidatus Omnitrophota bacterium]
MLKKNSQVFQAMFFFMDMVIVSMSWVSAYSLRFYTDIIPVLKGIPTFGDFFVLLAMLLPIHAFVFRYSGLYEPMRSSARAAEFKKIFKANLIATLVYITVFYLVKEYKYSRVVFVYFFCINVLLLSLFRLFLRLFLSWLRKRGYNLRYVLIVGDGVLGQDVEKKITEHAEYGFKVIGFLSQDKESVGKVVNNIPVLGTYKDVKEIIKNYNIDQLILALSFDHLRFIRPILGMVYDEMCEIKLIPDLFQYFTVRQSIDVLDGLPIINLRESPLYGWNRLLKRIFDIVVSMIIVFICSPLMCLAAVLIKLTSAGPVFYKQERMGLDGKNFSILKFRSMFLNAEKETGAVWAVQNDARRTKIGKIMRSISFDELPQFFNVLKGQMSIVGPRPERPEFMQEFKKRIPEYMLRHKMKAGITGWAQINGLRGNTSLEERTKFDLYYIENWSFAFDLNIIFRTIFAFKNNAY